MRESCIIKSFLYEVIEDWKAKQSKATDGWLSLQARIKMDGDLLLQRKLLPDVFYTETLNNYLAFGHNGSHPSREPDWAQVPTHCLGVCNLAHCQASLQVPGVRVVRYRMAA